MTPAVHGPKVGSLSPLNAIGYVHEYRALLVDVTDGDQLVFTFNGFFLLIMYGEHTPVWLVSANSARGLLQRHVTRQQRI